jgi:hypothetical protein
MFKLNSFIFSLLLTSGLTAQTPTGPIPKSFFGNTLMNTSDWTIPAGELGSLGKGSGVTWPYVEPSRGSYDWSRLDAYVSAASSHGASMFYANEGVPPWAAANQSTCSSAAYYGARKCSGTVANIQDWRNFVTALVTRYKGRIQAYELWNEPQQSFSGTEAQLATLTNTAHDIIRSLDPAATILSPSAVSYGQQYLDDYFAAGGTRAIDAVAMHAYPNPSNDVAEAINASMPVLIRNVMKKYGLSAKPLWDTESSWGYVSKGGLTNSDLRTAFIARSYILHWSVGITRLYWYSWDSTDIGELWSPQSGVSQAGIAYEQVFNWLNGATMSTCSTNGSTDVYHAVYTCALNRSGGSEAEVVWNTDGNKTYVVPSQYSTYLDLSGQSHYVPANHQVTIGAKPILLER